MSDTFTSDENTPSSKAAAIDQNGVSFPAPTQPALARQSAMRAKKVHEAKEEEGGGVD